MSVIAHMVEEMIRDRRPDFTTKITQEQYLQWARGFVFEGLRDQRYGQSFCNHFGITDNILFYSPSVDEADRYIQKNYVE